MKITYYSRRALLGWLVLVLAILLGGACVPEELVVSPLGMVVVGAGEDIQIRSLEVLTGIGVRGIPRQRAVAMAVADYGPIKGHKVTMGAGLDSLCTAEGGAAAADTVDVYLSGLEFSFGGNVNGATGESGHEVYAAYQQRYNDSANPAYVALAYDATTLLLRAIGEVAAADGETLYIDRARLREVLANTTDFDGIIGSISCDGFGDCGTGRIHISHYTDPTVSDIAEVPVVFRYEP